MTLELDPIETRLVVLAPEAVDRLIDVAATVLAYADLEVLANGGQDTPAQDELNAAAHTVLEIVTGKWGRVDHGATTAAEMEDFFAAPEVVEAYARAAEKVVEACRSSVEHAANAARLIRQYGYALADCETPAELAARRRAA